MERQAGADAPSHGRIPAWVRTAAWAVLAAALALRVAVLALTPLQLYPDEAQYWNWAQALQPGYYTKPPLIAWLIAATTALFGDGEWAVRLAAPLCHGATAVIVALLGRELFGARAGLIAGAIWLSMGGVTLSSLLVSTDAPLLVCWSLMLLALARLVRTRAWLWAAVLGAAFGLGFMAKYAMVYALIGVALGVAFDARVRTALLSSRGALALALALLIFAPNLIWNIANGMTTVRHTADNADWGGGGGGLEGLGEFWGSQLGVFGIVLIPLLLVAGVRAARGRMGADARLLTFFIWPPLLIVSAQSVLSHADANWAATAYPAGAALMGGWLARTWRGGASGALGRRLTIVALAVNIGLSGILTASFLSPAFAGRIGLDNAFKRVRGWDATTRQIFDAARAGGFDTVTFDSRFQFHASDYYGRDDAAAPALTMWMRYAAPRSHAETCCALPRGAERVLIVSQFPEYHEWFARDFARLEDRGEIVTQLGGGVTRRLRLYEAAGYAPVSER